MTHGNRLWNKDRLYDLVEEEGRAKKAGLGVVPGARGEHELPAIPKRSNSKVVQFQKWSGPPQEREPLACVPDSGFFLLSN